MSELFSDEKINKDILNNHLEAFCFSTGVSIAVIDELGRLILSVGEEASFCQYLKKCLDRECSCPQSHLHAGKISADIGEAYIFFCPAGLVHLAAPLLRNGDLVGALMAGPVLIDEPDEIMLDDIIQKFQFAVSKKVRLHKHLSEIQVLGPEKVRYLANLLFIIATNMMPLEKKSLKLKNTKHNQQAEIGEIIQKEKQNNILLNCYPYEKEKELLRRVKSGDVYGSKAILNDLLGCVFLSTGGNIEIMKARVLELCTLLSRAAVEGGASLEKIFGMNFRFISTLSKIQSIEDLSFWTSKVLERFTNNVFDLADSKHGALIKDAIKYINQHFSRPLTLNEVANIVHLNPTYFSSVFNKEVGMSFSDYLNKVRIEESKKVLKKRECTILNVALAVGYENQSYYSKVFKKYTGITPKVFRDKI